MHKVAGRWHERLPFGRATSFVLAASGALIIWPSRVPQVCIATSRLLRQPRANFIEQRASQYLDCSVGTRTWPRSRLFSYYMLHKPVGIVSQRGETFYKNVYDLFDSLVSAGRVPGPAPPPRVSPVGRLDVHTSGLMVLTNDAPLHRRLCDARCTKRYLLVVAGSLREDSEEGGGGSALASMRSPYMYKRKETACGRETWTLPADVRLLRTWQEPVRPGEPAWLGNRSELEVSIVEGRHHQVRRLCAREGLNLLRLHRASVGPLELGTLAEGEARPLTPEELADLYEVCGVGGDASDERGD